MKTVEATTTENTATVAAQGASVAPEKSHSKKDATKKEGAPKGKKVAKGGKAKAPAPKQTTNAGKKPAAKPARTKEAGAPRAESKGAKILELIDDSGPRERWSSGGPAEEDPVKSVFIGKWYFNQKRPFLEPLPAKPERLQPR